MNTVDPADPTASAPPALSGRGRGDSLKSVLLDKAFDLLDQNGPDGVTIRAVARAAGVSHAAPANHFPDRRQLLTEMATAIFRQYLERVDDYPGPCRARAYLGALVAYAIAFPGRYELLWRTDLVAWDSPVFRADLNRTYADYVEALRTSPASSAHPGRDIETLATAAWSMAHGYAELRSTGIFEPRTDAATGQTRLDAMLDLMLGPQARSSETG